MMTSDSTSRREYLARTGTVIGALSLGVSTISGSALAQTEISESTVITEPGNYELSSYVLSIQIQADNVTLNGNGWAVEEVTSEDTSNVTLRNLIAGSGRGTGVDFRGVSNCTAEEVNVPSKSRGGLGVYMSGSGNRVANSSFSDMRGIGIVVEGSNNTVSNNTCSNVYDGEGISIEGSNNTIEDNTLNGIYGSGIVLNGDKNRLRNNIVTNAGNKRTAAIRLRDSNKNHLMSNTINSNDGDGINLRNSNNNRVIQNESTNNIIGIMIQNSSRNTVVRNDVRDNDRGGIVDEGTNNQIRANREG